MNTEDYYDDIARLRVPPHALEAEHSVLGGLLLDNGAWDRCGDILVESDFYRSEHQLIYQVIGGLINACKPADVLTVFEQIRALGKLTRHDVTLDYINALAQSVPSAANIRRYAEIVREKAILRKLIAASDEIATAAFNPEGKGAAEILDMAQASMLKVAEEGPQGGDEWDSPDRSVVRVIDHINAVHSGEAKVDVIPTGIDDLDERLGGGLRPGELATLGMRSGMGKTAMGLTILRNAAKRGEPGGIFSFEMPTDQLTARMISAESHVHLTKLKRPERLNEWDWGQLSHATELVGKLPIAITDKSGLTIDKIRSRARALKRKFGVLRLLVVDHLALVRGRDPKMLRTYQLQEVTSGLKDLAKELHTAVLLLVQINRAADGRTDPMPQLADIRDTSSVEDDSDIIIFGHREYKNNPNLSDEWKYFGELLIAKQRDGELGRLPVMFVGENTRFENWPKDTPVPTTKTKKSAL